MKSKAIVIGIGAILVIAGLVWYLQKDGDRVPSSSNQAKQEQSAKPLEEGLGAQVYEKVQNPVKDEVPEANPIKKVKTNPFKEEYINPFE